MHIRVKVKDLSLRQWDWLQDNVQVEYDFAPFEPRACVEFELTPDLNVRHVEMPVPALAGLLMVLQSLDPAVTATAALSPDELPDHLEGQRNAADPQRAAERA
jgi:hypothetical protein